MELDLDFMLPQWDSNKKLADPDLLMFYKLLEARHIWLDSEITLENCSFLIKYIQLLNVSENTDRTPIHLHIMSDGGDLTTMFTLYDIIKASEIPVYTINEGAAHSAAFIVFLAGDVRKVRPNATFIAHEGSGQAGGTFKQVQSAILQYQKDVDRMIAIIAEETGMSKDMIREKFNMNADWYINYEEAEGLGIIKEDK